MPEPSNRRQDFLARLRCRPRRNRTTAAIRDLVRETLLSPADFILPLFVIDGENGEEPIDSMPVSYTHLRAHET